MNTMKTKLPFKRPTPLDRSKAAADFHGYVLSSDDNPIRFLVPVHNPGYCLITSVFKDEADAWKEAAYQAVGRGHDPSSYVDMASRRTATAGATS